MQHASVSLSVLNQLPNFIQDNSPLFEKFLSYYYKSQERAGGSIGFLNNISDYLNLSKYDFTKLDGNTTLIRSIAADATNIEVETTDGFVEKHGTLLINDEIVYYESLKKSASINLSAGLSYQEFSKKIVDLSNPYLEFDGIKTEFNLKLTDIPVFPRSASHLIVKVYNEYLIPEVDYTLVNDKIIFTTAPREFDAINESDTVTDVSIQYLKGFDANTIDIMDTILPGENSEKIYKLKKDNKLYLPPITTLVVCIVDGNILIPFDDYSVYEDNIIFKNVPLNSIYIGYINAQALSVGFGSQAYSVVDDEGRIQNLLVKSGGKGYTLNNAPRVSINGGEGKFATAKSLVNGVKNVTLIDGGSGYSKVNPPLVVISSPEGSGTTQATAKVTVNDDGFVSSLILTNSGSGYENIPRIQFVNPTGAEVNNPVVVNGTIQSISVLESGYGYTNPPQIYIDPPQSENGIQAIATAVLDSEGKVVGVTMVTGGTGYSSSSLPRVKVIQPTGAQILDVEVDDFGRIINIELLNGGFGYTDVPSVYIVDDRKDNIGNYIGGSGAKAVATIFNGQIIDINITNFGTGYSKENPPKVYISSTPGAKASCEIGNGEITGFDIINPGTGYVKSQFLNCARGVSGIYGYDSNNNVLFKKEQDSIATIHPLGSSVKSIDSVFMKKILDKITGQYLPGLPALDANTLNIDNVLSTIKDFYASKGTVYAVKYLFKLLYGSEVEVSYPKDQIIRPSAATWSVDTVLRCKIVSGNPENLRDSLIEQLDSDIDSNVNYANALIENYTAIQTSEYDVYELVLSEETIFGDFTIPYSTKLVNQLLEDDVIIDVDSTIGWPERNGEVVINNEIIRYKEKSLTQFIECTRGINNTVASEWDSGTIVTSNFYIYANRGTEREVVLSILGIVDANQTTLIDDGSYYLSGDKLAISKLGSDDTTQLVRSWLYNVKKLLKIENITFGGVDNKTATVTCFDPHGLLVGDQVTVYGANPIVYNGSFLVSSRESATVFKYTLPQSATLNPQGNILISIDLNTGKSDATAINNSITKFPANIQNSFLNQTHVYVAASGIPNYKIGPFVGTALLPGNQRKLYKFPRVPTTISLKTDTVPGPIGSLVNGVSVWNYKSQEFYPFGPVTKINIINSGSGYDAASPPNLTISGGGGSNAEASVIVDGSVIDIEVLQGGSGYTSSPLVSIYGSDGIGASATAVITNGSLSRVLMNSVGSGYTSEPTVTITGGGGTGAVAKAIVRGPIKSVVIDNQGTSYTEEPDIKLSSGQGAAAQAYVSNGRITSIAIIAAGFGYTTAPEVIITGDGFGAKAKATISSEGVESGRVINIEILNRGVGYNQGTTQIRLESIGEGAKFEAEIFKWVFNLNETTNFDYANGSIFVGFNSQYGGEYAHISNPKQLRYVLGDNLDLIDGDLVEKESVQHSPILGWAFDGNPIYGPYGLSDPTSLSSSIVPIRSGYQLKENLVYNVNTNPVPVRIEGPSLAEFPAGTFVDDYEYKFNSLAIYLDEYNGRYCKTPEFPDGVYAYFVTIDPAGISSFPYILGPKYYSAPEIWNLNQFATQSYIPSGVVRYRTPFENVDIDIERSPNQSTNAITLENGDFLSFEIEDENKDGLISQDEIDDPDILFEEKKLEVFDYFPKVDIQSKVDIEVETTTKFEDAKITGFLIENRGENYQVNDRLIFDDSKTGGYGASARIAEIEGKNITSYTYEYDSFNDQFKAVVQTDEAHTLLVGDSVKITTTPTMEPTSKTIKVKAIKGLEQLTVVEDGIGYEPDFIPEIDIESTSGDYAEVLIQPSTTGIISDFIIKNSGQGYLTNPLVRISHPQTKKKSDYFYSEVYNENYKIVPQNIIVNSDKSYYLMGSQIDVSSETGNTELADKGYFGKYNSEGLQIYGKIFTSSLPNALEGKVDIISACKKNLNLYVVGRTYPNQQLSASFNPDIFLCKFVESETGATATTEWKIEISGVSGVTRSDVITDVVCVGDNVVLVGYTNTNTTSVQDGFVILVNSSGVIVGKRKITSSSLSEKFYQAKVDSNNNIFILGNSNDNTILVSKLYIQSTAIKIDWVKEYSLTGYKFTNLSFDIDEYDELYITSVPELISTQARTKLQLLRISNSGTIVSNTFTTISNSISIDASKCSADIFGNISISYNYSDTNSIKSIGVIKYKYDGSIIHSTKLVNNQNLKGLSAVACASDSSGDQIIVGNSQQNRTQFVYNAENGLSDVTGRNSSLVSSGSATTTTDFKFGTNAYTIPSLGRLRTTTTVQNNNWTIEFWLKYDSIPTTNTPRVITVTDGSNNLYLEVQGSTGAPSTYGKIRTEVGGVAGSWSTLSDVLTQTNGQYAHIAVTKSFENTITTYTIFVNGVQYSQQTSSTNINPATIDFGNTTGTFSYAMKIDDIRLSNYEVYTASFTVPTAHAKVNYGTASGDSNFDWYPDRSFVFKVDKNADPERVGNITLAQNNYSLSRTSYTVTSSLPETNITTSDYILASEGLQILDFNYATATSIGVTTSSLTQLYDLWSSRTATIPTVGGKKVKVNAKVLDKFYFKTFDAAKVDNVVKITLNQDFNFNVGTTITQYSSIGSVIASGKIIGKNLSTDTLTISDITGNFTLNSGYLRSSDDYVNEIQAYVFQNVNNITLGNFEVEIPGTLDAEFKPYSDNDYLIRIESVSAGSPYVVGSVITLTPGQISFTTNKQEAVISGLTGVSKISVITNLKKILQITTEENTDLIFIRSNISHYLTNESIISSVTTYAPLAGTFSIEQIISKKEFLIKLREVPATSIANESVIFYVKNPIFKFIFGQQYTFDTSDSSMQGHYLSFYRDNLYKIEYTFKNIVRRGVPGFDEPGNSPFISFKVTDDVSAISYYADPADLSSEGPVTNLSYIDVRQSPYIGTFNISDLAGGTITEGPNKFKFILDFEPEKVATASSSSYSTTSTKAVGPIARIRLVNGGGFYQKLPVISGIQSSRKIERVEIINPGTEYEAGEYFGVPILGDGTGGKVSILVDGTTDPAGQIVEVTVTDPGKGYTTGFIDVDAIDGILGPTLSGSGAELEVIIPPVGSGASIFAKGRSVGKIKKLKNNNFGFNYTHDYTLRPEITFPVNLQLINTSILSAIKITDPGTGYTTPPEVVITGGGGSGAIAQSFLKNGRISDIIVKDPGFGYSSNPTVELKSSFTYVVNLDLGLFQFSFPHGIQNAAEVQFQVQDLGDGATLPLTSFGYITPTQIYYAISGSAAGLEDDQLRIALTEQDAISGNFIAFANSGTGRQIILTSSFGGTAEAIVETGRFLAGELVYQGESLDTATATGFVSANDGWQIGPRILKLNNVEGTFEEGLQVNGVISRANGTIEEINIAKGVLEVDSTTRTIGKFSDDIGKPSEIVQKIQDSYLYQAFSYNVKSPVSIEGWRDTLINTTHPAGFKVFGEIGIDGGGKGLTDKTDFELTKSVNLIESSVVSNIDNYTLVEPIYQEFDNTQVLFRSLRLTSSEEILTSVVQILDDISPLFDGERTTFPATIEGQTVIADTSQFMLVINGVAQAPGVSFVVQQGSIVFAEAPPAPTKISYANLSLQFLPSYTLTITNVSGILPELGNTVRGLTTNTLATVISSTTSTISVFNLSGSGFQNGETLISTSTGLNCSLVSQQLNQTDNIFRFGERISNTNKKTAKVEEINLDTNTNIVTNELVISKASGTYDSPSGLLALQLNDFIIGVSSNVVAKIIGLSPYQDPTTGEFLSSIVISDPSTFYGLLFNRVVNPLQPNAILDDISKSLIEVSDLNDPEIKVESRFVSFEDVSNVVLDYEYKLSSPDITVGDLLQNIKINYINESGNFTVGEDVSSRKLSYVNLTGGNFIQGDTIRGITSGVTATIIGVNYALKTLYLGNKSGNFTLGEEIRTNISGATKFGNADLSIDQKKFGSSSLYLDGTGDYITISNATNYDFGDYTLEAWIYVPSLPTGTYSIVFSLTGGQNFYWGLRNIAGTLYLTSYDGVTVNEQSTGTTVQLNQWTHVSWTRTGSTIRSFVNGTLVHTGSSSVTADVTGLMIGYDDTYTNQYQFNGYIDEVRVSNTARYTNTFTAPTAAFITDNNTKLLMHFDVVRATTSNYLEIPFIAQQVNTTNKTFVTGQIYDDAKHRFRDAANTLRLNSTYIIEEAVGRMKNRYPDLDIPGDSSTSSDGTNRCKLDLSLLLDAVIKDVENGGNYESVTAARFYLDANGGLEYIRLQALQSLYAHTQMSDLCQDAISGDLAATGVYTNQIPVPPIGVIPDTITNCANVKSAINSLWEQINDIIAPAGQVYRDAADQLWFNRTYIAQEATGYIESFFAFNLNGIPYSGFTYPGGNSTVCERDITEYIIPSIITDLLTGGNANIITAMEYYVGNGNEIEYVKDELLPTVVAFEKVNQLCQYAIDNWVINGTTSTIYTTTYGATATKYIDSSIPADDGTYGGNCERIKASIDTLFNLAVGILIPERPLSAPGTRANLLNADVTTWQTVSTTVATSTAVTAPDGTTTGIYKATLSDITNGAPRLGHLTSFTSGKTYTSIVYLKSAEITTAAVFWDTTAVDPNYSNSGLYIDLATGQVKNSSGVVQDLEPSQIAVEDAGNGWWKVSSTSTIDYSLSESQSSSPRRLMNITIKSTGNVNSITNTGTNGIYIWGARIEETYADSSSRYYDAANLIDSNKLLIADVAVGRMLANYPGFTIPNGNQNCKDDIVDILTALTYDLRNGGNARIYDYAQVYTVHPYLSGEQTQANYAFNQARDLAIEAMRNVTITLGGHTTRTQVKDLTIIADPETGSNQSALSCKNVASSITTLFSILTTAVTNGNMSHVTRNSEADTTQAYRNAAKLVLFNKEHIKYEALQRTLNNYPGFSVPGGNTKCLRDIGYIVDAIVYDLLTGGNSAIIEATLSYIDAATGTILSLEGELIQSIYAYGQVKLLLNQSVSETLTSPGSASGQYAYTDSAISIVGPILTEIQNFIDDRMDILLGTLNNPEYIETNQIIPSTLVTIPTKTYPTRSPLTPLSGQLSVGDYIYGSTSVKDGEVQQITFNRGTVKVIYQRFEIEYSDNLEVFEQGQQLTIPGQSSNTCIIDSIEPGEFVSYIDVIITGGSFAIGNTLINDDGFTATIEFINDRIQIVKVVGEFDSGEYATGLYSDAEIIIDNYEYNYAPVLSSTGGRLILETESIQGEFITTRRIYPTLTEKYIDVIVSGSSTVDTGSRIQSTVVYKFTITYEEATDNFPIGLVILNSQNFTNTANILGFEVVNPTTAYLYLGNFAGSVYSLGTVLHYYTNTLDQFPSGIGTIIDVDILPSEGYALVERVSSVGSYTRLYLSGVVGDIGTYSNIISNGGYKAAIVSETSIEGRITRSFLGFNGQQTQFKLSTNNGDPYFPDPDGHLLVFLNGILQPPTSSFGTFSDIIQFTEPPEVGASFHSVYVGKLRQLDDISFEFDSLRNSFNLKLNEVFYSLTVTDGVQSDTIKPENNLIISLNGVIQEPGIGFELVGSRIIFAEVPRAGSTFVGFAYVGSESDVISTEVVPPIEPGDLLEIQSEDEDRTVAIIESSNTLITFDYLGSVLGRGAEALANIITGRISKLQLTSSGDGYTSRPIVSFDSSTGFDGQAKALVGISRVNVVDSGSGYAYPTVEVSNIVPEPPVGFEFNFDDSEASFDTNAVTFDQT